MNVKFEYKTFQHVELHRLRIQSLINLDNLFQIIVIKSCYVLIQTSLNLQDTSKFYLSRSPFLCCLFIISVFQLAECDMVSNQNNLN